MQRSSGIGKSEIVAKIPLIYNTLKYNVSTAIYLNIYIYVDKKDNLQVKLEWCLHKYISFKNWFLTLNFNISIKGSTREKWKGAYSRFSHCNSVARIARNRAELRASEIHLRWKPGHMAHGQKRSMVIASNLASLCFAYKEKIV